jgi:putative hydrolase of the HAD superfamily
MKYTQNFLKALQVKQPIKTGMEPLVYKDNDIKAVIFDIYGTLLISASGDIEEAEMLSKNILTTFDAVNIQWNTIVPVETAGLVLTAFAREIKNQQKIKRNKDVLYPEIDIKIVWENVLKEFAERDFISHDVDDDTIAEIAFIFELLSNPVYPMPEMQKIINTLSGKQIPMGIVSNAQFYTPLCMNYFLSGDTVESEIIENFDTDLTVFSYQRGIGKPDTFLYELLIEPLWRKYKLKPSEVLFVGNDMKKDIMAAQKTGLKTALFAGDMRSLRLRKDDPEIAKTKPDFIITELTQLFGIVK